MRSSRFERPPARIRMTHIMSRNIFKIAKTNGMLPNRAEDQYRKVSETMRTLWNMCFRHICLTILARCYDNGLFSGVWCHDVDLNKHFQDLTFSVFYIAETGVNIGRCQKQCALYETCVFDIFVWQYLRVAMTMVCLAVFDAMMWT